MSDDLAEKVLDFLASPEEALRNAHPIAALFPMLSSDELAELAADIKERGLLQPVVVSTSGQVLDGRNRLAACELAGVKPTYTIYEGDDPAGFALSVNRHRRNLTKGQMAMIVVQTGLFPEETMREAESNAGVSATGLAKASTVLAHAKDLADAVVSGVLPLNEAYKTAADRKKADADTDAETQALRDQAPDLADLVIEERMTLAEALAALRQRKADRQKVIRLDQAGLQKLVDGWGYLKSLSLAEEIEREEVLAGLNDDDQATVLEIEAIYKKRGKR